MKVRIQFTKHGAIKYIGHLDMMRYFQKAIRRADIPIKYSTGFSPHQIMSFAAPLGVGLESEGEYFDIEVENLDGKETMKERLNKTMAEGVTISSMVLLPDQATNAMASVAAASYEVRFACGKEPDFSVEEAISKLMESENIPYTKITKKSEIELDLKQGIYELKGNNEMVYMLVDASSSGNIKPSTVMEVIYRTCNQTVPEFALQITRTDTYTQNADGKLIPLREVGEELA